MDINAIDTADGGHIAQTIHCRANERSTAESVVDKLSLQRNRRTVRVNTLGKSGNLTFNGVRGRLLFAGNTGVERGSTRVHVASWREARQSGCRVQAQYLAAPNLAKVPTPPATTTHVPIPHLAVVEGLVETLSRRHISVGGEEFAAMADFPEVRRSRPNRVKMSLMTSACSGNGVPS